MYITLSVIHVYITIIVLLLTQLGLIQVVWQRLLNPFVIAYDFVSWNMTDRFVCVSITVLTVPWYVRCILLGKWFLQRTP